MAASVTVRASGPAVSWSAVIGTMPSRLTRPTVGLMPTSRFCVPGLRIDPEVSVVAVSLKKKMAKERSGHDHEPDGANRSQTRVKSRHGTVPEKEGRTPYAARKR